MFAQSVGILISASLIMQSVFVPRCLCCGTSNCCCQGIGRFNRCCSAAIPIQLPSKVCCKTTKHVAVGETLRRSATHHSQVVAAPASASAECTCAQSAAAQNAVTKGFQRSAQLSWRAMISYLSEITPSFASIILVDIDIQPVGPPDPTLSFQVATALERCISLGRLLT